MRESVKTLKRPDMSYSLITPKPRNAAHNYAHSDKKPTYYNKEKTWAIWNP